MNMKKMCIRDSSGISASTLSRYRSGERVPELGSAAFDGLCDAIAGIAADREDADITAASVKEAVSYTHLDVYKRQPLHRADICLV